MHEYKEPKGIKIGDTFITSDGDQATVIRWSSFQETETKEQMVLCRARKGAYPPKMFKPSEIRRAMAAEARLRKELVANA